jgi:hypothetical protein
MLVDVRSSVSVPYQGRSRSGNVNTRGNLMVEAASIHKLLRYRPSRSVRILMTSLSIPWCSKYRTSPPFGQSRLALSDQISTDQPLRVMGLEEHVTSNDEARSSSTQPVDTPLRGGMPFAVPWLLLTARSVFAGRRHAERGKPGIIFPQSRGESNKWLRQHSTLKIDMKRGSRPKARWHERLRADSQTAVGHVSMGRGRCDGCLGVSSLHGSGR